MGSSLSRSTRRGNCERSDNIFRRTWIRGTDARFGLSHRSLPSTDLSVFSKQSRPDRGGLSAGLYVAMERSLGKAFSGSADTARAALKRILQELPLNF